MRAAATAASTSVSVPPAYVPTTVSWPGLRLSNVAPCPSLFLPPMIIGQCGASMSDVGVLMRAHIPFGARRWVRCPAVPFPTSDGAWLDRLNFAAADGTVAGRIMLRSWL